MKFRSVRLKFLMAMLWTTVIALLISSVIGIVYNLSSYRENTARDLLSQATLMSRATTPSLQFNDQQAAQDFLDLSDGNPQVRAAALYDSRGNLFAGYVRNGINKQNLPALPETDGVSIKDGVMTVYSRIVANEEILGTVFLEADYKFHEKLMVNLGITFGGIMLALVVSFLLSLWLQASITRPILAVTHQAREVVEQGNFTLRAKKYTNDEVGTLVDSFNAMLSEVEKSQSALAKSNQELAQEIKDRILAEQAQREFAEQVRQLNTELERRVRERTLQLETANGELEAFSYSVSHDLRAPLRAIDGFSQALLEDYQDKVDDCGRDYLKRVRAAAQRMGNLIDDLLNLSRVSRTELKVEEVNLSEVAENVCEELREGDPERVVAVQITSSLMASCDPRLMRIALQNLLHNAWKYSGRQEEARIEFGMRHKNGEAVYFVQDNGVGFDMNYAGKLFGAFQRLHNVSDFPGTGVGLATVKRIISRHGGKVWAESKPDKGAVFYFTLEVPDTSQPKTIAKEKGLEYQTNIAG